MNIGIVTFHRVYNYGAVIQAYSLQKFLSDNMYESDIIDFSKPKQRDYTNIISIHNGTKRFIKTLMLTPVIVKRLKRKKKFNEFIQHKMKISNKMYTHEAELEKINSVYDIFLVGSDQVWNVNKGSDTSTAYFLRFVSSQNKKISYASSIGITKKEDLLEYKDDLERFEYLSCREKGGTEIIEEVVEKTVQTVLDPTLLVEQKALMDLTEENNDSKYILYYSLDGYDKKERNMDILLELKKKFRMELKIVTPEWPFQKKYGEDVIDAGPEEFLSLIRNAALVCTNSFHGTALSIKFERPFYVLEERNIKDERKRSILDQLYIKERQLEKKSDVYNIENYEMDYEPIKKRLMELQKISSEYLLNALSN